MLVAQPPDFRWLERRDDSPWYPTLRLFRQVRRGEWSEIVARVAAALRDRVAQPRPATTRPARAAVKPRALSATGPTDWPGPAGRLAAVAETRYGLLAYLPHRGYEGKALRHDSEDLAWYSALVAGLQPLGGVAVVAHAGIGLPLLPLSAAAGSTGQLFAYEPDLTLRALLQRNLMVNGVKNVSLMRRGLGSRTDAPENTDTIDTLGLTRLDLVVVSDASDAPAIIDGATQSLWVMRPSLVVCGRSDQAEQELSCRIQSYGYRCWRVAKPREGAGNLDFGARAPLADAAIRAIVAVPEEREPPRSAREWISL